MSNSTSRLAYTDCTDLMDRALDNTRGIAVPFSTKGNALHFRSRLHTARNVCRAANVAEYPKDHPLHGRSIYDTLVIREPIEDEGKWLLRIEKISIEKLTIIPLGEWEDRVKEVVGPLSAPMVSITEAPAEIDIFDPEPKMARRV